jgi:diguanylate cyclase (GGDEF)-like protein/PAS domain S-box-containing protein
MEQTSRPSTSQSPESLASAQAEAAPDRLSALTTLLADVDEVQALCPSRKADFAHQNRLVQVRLGIATSLFHALRAKHAPTAAHSLRVGLACSSWALEKELDVEQRDALEVASLLHDIGKIGVPDALLEKVGKLSHDEFVAVERHRQDGLETLVGCCASPEVLEIVHFGTAWFDGSRDGFERRGNDLPQGARMLAIADAFDSMTTDHVYRRAMSRDRAMAVLFECAGTQFDPQLVRDFCSMLGQYDVSFHAKVARRWLTELHTNASNAVWSLGRVGVAGKETPVDSLFRQSLVNGMLDGVIFVDNCGRVLHWNRAAERLTGISSSSIHQKRWQPNLVAMHDESGDVVAEAGCPIAYVIESKVQSFKRLSIAARGGQRISVDCHIVPVIGQDGAAIGAAMVLHDASNQISLEERVESLHDKATKDPLTKISNRAVFDRALKQMVSLHLEQQQPCSLIICDLDYFKRINDTYGHQAGDEALVSFAALLKRHHRKGDVVARYGGEEFVLLCADCDNAAATCRAEEIRGELENLPQPMLEGRCITASFGVTELQHGDTPDTMLNRADRGLLKAKDLGRNRVVQLGSGICESDQEERNKGWLNLFKSSKPDVFLERHLATPVPMKMVAEKLKGFVADHNAEITSIEDDLVLLKLESEQAGLMRRTSDRSLLFAIRLQFEEARVESEGNSGTALQTMVHVTIRPVRNRDRRRKDVSDRARQLLVSLKSYLMAHEHIAKMTE